MDSPDELYKRARQRWSEYVDLATYADDEENVYDVTGFLQDALSVDGDHIPSLRMLSLLLAQVGAKEESLESVRQLLRLLPGDVQGQSLLRLLGQGSRDEQLDWLSGAWHDGKY